MMDTVEIDSPTAGEKIEPIENKSKEGFLTIKRKRFWVILLFHIPYSFEGKALCHSICQ